MKNLKKSKHILTVTLAAMIVLSTAVASVMSGCGKNTDSTGETIVVSETQIVTNVVEETYATDKNGETIVSNESSNSDSKADDNGNSSANSESGNNASGETSKTSSNSNSQSSNSSDKSDTSKTSNNSGSNKTQSSNTSSEKSESSKSESNNNSNSSNSSGGSSTNNNKSTTLSIDGNKFSKGSTVTCVYKLKSPEALENYQASIKYNSKYLKVKSAKLSEAARGGAILNFKLDGEIKFNGSNISSGYEYEKAGEFLTVTYEVLATGSTTTKFEWEVATGMSGKAYVTDNKAASGLKISKTYS